MPAALDLHEHGSESAEEELLPRHGIDLAEGTLDRFILVRVESLVQGDSGEGRWPDSGGGVYQESSGETLYRQYKYTVSLLGMLTARPYPTKLIEMLPKLVLYFPWRRSTHEVMIW